MPRDLRDPSALGEWLLKQKRDPEPLTASQRYDQHKVWFEKCIPNYTDGGVMSNDPKQHHSKTPYTIEPLGEPGGD